MAQYSIFEACAGTGMLGLAVKLALESIGIRADVVGCCERDACAAAALMAGLENETGSVPPVWDDVTSFIGRRARRVEPVDVLCAGYPCQGFSHAGKRGGTRDPRYLWPAVRRLVARLKPQIVFLENVDGHVSLGLGRVLRNLERLGYRTTAGVFSAEEVGAPHLRKRVFILGIRAGDGGRILDDSTGSRLNGKRQRTAANEQSGECVPCEGCTELAYRSPGGQRTSREPSQCDRQPDGCNKQLANASVERRSEVARGSLGDETTHGRGGQLQPNRANQLDSGKQDVANDNQQGLESRGPASNLTCRDRSPDKSRRIVPLFPPGRTDYRRWARLVTGGLDPTLMPSSEPGFPMVAHGMASSADLLRLGGNGVVPLCAAWAFLQLFTCLMEPLAHTRP